VVGVKNELMLDKEIRLSVPVNIKISLYAHVADQFDMAVAPGEYISVLHCKSLH
jgi:hypothetical protein